MQATETSRTCRVRWRRRTPKLTRQSAARPAAASAFGADRQRKFHLGSGPRGDGQHLYQQVRRRLSGQALLRRVRVRRRGGEPRPRSRETAVQSRIRQRAAALRIAGQSGCLCGRAAAGRYDHGARSCPWRTPHTRAQAEFFGQDIPHRRLSGEQGNRADRFRPDGEDRR